MKRNFKVLSIALIAIIIAGSAYAFAAANTVEKSAAGYVGTTVSGYAITNIVYDFNTDLTKVDKISFDIAPVTNGDPVPSWVKISVTASQNFGTSTCALNTGNTVAICTFTDGETDTPIDVANIVKFDVVASSSVNPS